MRFFILIAIFIVCCYIEPGICDKKHKNKYSAEANRNNDLPPEKFDPDFRTLQKPYRMAKLNMVWSKAQQVSKTINSP